jgi:hypothetical protein
MFLTTCLLEDAEVNIGFSCGNFLFTTYKCVITAILTCREFRLSSFFQLTPASPSIVPVLFTVFLPAIVLFGLFFAVFEPFVECFSYVALQFVMNSGIVPQNAMPGDIKPCADQLIIYGRGAFGHVLE